MRIGIDIGNVIIGGEGEDTIFSEQWFDTPVVEGAIQSIMRLWRLDHELHIISKCGPKTEEKSLILLGHYGLLGDSPYSVLRIHRTHFVRKRELKAPMAQALELDIFIDDRQDVLDHMVEIVPHLILFTSWEQTNAELDLAFEMRRAFAASKR